MRLHQQQQRRQQQSPSWPQPRQPNNCNKCLTIVQIDKVNNWMNENAQWKRRALMYYGTEHESVGYLLALHLHDIRYGTHARTTATGSIVTVRWDILINKIHKWHFMLCVANMRKPDAQIQTNKQTWKIGSNRICNSTSEHDKIMIKNNKITKCAPLFDCNIINGCFTVSIIVIFSRWTTVDNATLLRIVRTAHLFSNIEPFIQVSQPVVKGWPGEARAGGTQYPRAVIRCCAIKCK